MPGTAPNPRRPASTMGKYSFEEKLERARHHYESLWPEFGRWIKTHPYRVTDELDPDTGDNIVRLDSVDQPPPIIAQILGDCLHNLRAALDHVVYALAIANKLTLTDEEARETAFPIFKKFPERWPWPAIQHVSPEAQAIIERLQPYHAGNRATVHPLWILRTLENIDKHRRLLITLGTQGAAAAQCTPNARMQSLDWSLYARGPEPKAEIARYRFIDANTGERMKVDFVPVFIMSILDTSFREAMAADAVLRAIASYIEDEVFQPLRDLLVRAECADSNNPLVR
jgi:hypothetical protein